MSRRALALKYRPQAFDEVVGQEVSVQILKNAIREGRLHHATLLTGPRGVGKTSLARILAKALNCEKGPTVTPCGACQNCLEITEGRSLSVIEIDGASNTSVDDVRDLRERVRYLAPGGRYKIYIIDEVHMLSTAAFNALLKTLEEPPPHALFVFATTEPQKLPLTIISRCLRFDLRPIPTARVVDHLKKVASSESIQVEEEALYEIAREASGGLRDALGLMEQAASFSGNRVDQKVVEEILGASPRRFVVEILSAVLKKDPSAVLKVLLGASGAGIDPRRLATTLLEFARHLLVARVSNEPTLFDLPVDEVQRLKELGGSVSESSLDHIFRMTQRGVGDLLRSPMPGLLLEVLALRLCHFDELQSLETILKLLEGKGEGQMSLELPVEPPPPVISPNPPPQRSEEKGWGAFVSSLQSKRPQLASLLTHVVGVDLQEKEVTLSLPQGSVYLEILGERERLAQLEDSLVTHFGRPIKARIVGGEGKGEPTGVIDEAISIFQPTSIKSTSPL